MFFSRASLLISLIQSLTAFASPAGPSATDQLVERKRGKMIVFYSDQELTDPKTQRPEALRMGSQVCHVEFYISGQQYLECGGYTVPVQVSEILQAQARSSQLYGTAAARTRTGRTLHVRSSDFYELARRSMNRPFRGQKWKDRYQTLLTECVALPWTCESADSPLALRSRYIQIPGSALRRKVIRTDEDLLKLGSIDLNYYEEKTIGRSYGADADKKETFRYGAVVVQSRDALQWWKTERFDPTVVIVLRFWSMDEL